MLLKGMWFWTIKTNFKTYLYSLCKFHFSSSSKQITRMTQWLLSMAILYFIFTELHMPCWYSYIYASTFRPDSSKRIDDNVHEIILTHIFTVPPQIPTWPMFWKKWSPEIVAKHCGEDVALSDPCVRNCVFNSSQ